MILEKMWKLLVQELIIRGSDDDFSCINSSIQLLNAYDVRN